MNADLRFPCKSRLPSDQSPFVPPATGFTSHGPSFSTSAVVAASSFSSRLTSSGSSVCLRVPASWPRAFAASGSIHPFDAWLFCPSTSARHKVKRYEAEQDGFCRIDLFVSVSTAAAAGQSCGNLRRMRQRTQHARNEHHQNCQGHIQRQPETHIGATSERHRCAPSRTLAPGRKSQRLAKKNSMPNKA